MSPTENSWNGGRKEEDGDDDRDDDDDGSSGGCAGDDSTLNAQDPSQEMELPHTTRPLGKMARD